MTSAKEALASRLYPQHPLVVEAVSLGATEPIAQVVEMVLAVARGLGWSEADVCERPGEALYQVAQANAWRRGLEAIAEEMPEVVFVEDWT